MAQKSFWRDLLTSAPEFFESNFGKGATEAQIAAIEEKFSIKIPASYRAFLLEVGWAEVDMNGVLFAIAGVGSDIPEDLDLSLVIEAARRGGIPEALLPVVDAGDQLFLDLSTPEGAVVFLGEDNEKEALAPTFAEWLTEELSE